MNYFFQVFFFLQGIVRGMGMVEEVEQIAGWIDMLLLDPGIGDKQAEESNLSCKLIKNQFEKIVYH